MEPTLIKIPKDRIGALIGKNGKTKNKIEKLTQTEIKIDSRTGDVEIIAKGDDLMHLKAINIVKAIGRGFSPENAMLLLEDENYLEIINIQEFTGKSKKALIQKRGRLIGRKGLARKKLEELTNTVISVYGKTISIIGKPEDISLAREAIEMLLEGAKHSTVYDFLKRKILARSTEVF
ncbi:MAG: RNA-processing protein [Candidatus Iainarchaeum archaeon]|uniref:RNA-processing protein n=1 Tax=Candidatus Iainarchaeum sp. TaxID=3101447 RepID=A0A497JL54_9ARCH|nr:MAG: RNA-processing protein [Candidatus Diapherotrites archaeon]